MLDFPMVRRYLGHRVLCSVADAGPRLALTFDDGPNPRNTPRLLDLLAEKGVVATFFLVGRRVRQFPELARRIARAGHEIGNHGFHHVPLTLLPGPLMEREIRTTNQIVADVVGHRPRFLRPPMGWISRGVLDTILRQENQAVIGSVYPRDPRQPGVEIIVRRVLSRVQPGDIVILHDGGWRTRTDRSQTITAVDRLVDVLRGRGMAFRTVGELVEDGRAERPEVVRGPA